MPSERRNAFGVLDESEMFPELQALRNALYVVTEVDGTLDRLCAELVRMRNAAAQGCHL
jgi:hypothetical protein